MPSQAGYRDEVLCERTVGMRFTCPKCNREFNAARPRSGRPVACAHCGHEFVDLEPTVLDDVGPASGGGIAPGKLLGGFLIEERIGAGAMGVVYRAVQLSLQRIVALKILPPAFATNPALVRRFHEETAVLSALNHPNIVTIIDRGNVGRIYFFVMEYVDGPSLYSILSGPVDVEQFLKIAAGTAAALQYAHEHEVVHRDIKPSNIMLNSLGEVKIADFGLAGLMTHNGSRQQDGQRHARMGTPAYMSPEQRADPHDVDGRTDIYSAGVVFYELLTGERPQLPLQKMPSAVCGSVDPRLDVVVARCLMEEADERFQDAGKLLGALSEFAHDLERAPHCLSCGLLSHVRAEACVHCGHDLSELFDICPECRRRNRRDVRTCLHCGADLERGRTLISNRVSMMLNQADSLRLSGAFEEAVEILEDIQAIEGRAFEEQRERARLMREKTLSERVATAKRDYARARRLVREHSFREANELFKKVPPDVIDTSKAVQAARQLQEQLAAERRSKATINLLLLALGLIMVMVGIFVFVLKN